MLCRPWVKTHGYQQMSLCDRDAYVAIGTPGQLPADRQRDEGAGAEAAGVAEVLGEGLAQPVARWGSTGGTPVAPEWKPSPGGFAATLSPRGEG